MANTKDSAIEPALLNKREAARFLTISVNTLTKYKVAGLIPSVQLGKSVRFRRDVLEKIAREGF